MANITRKDIPDAKYYVLANDPFLSGWGEAKGKINTIILPCRDYYEAAFVKSHAESRGDMNRIRIVSNKPSLRSGVYYSLHDWNDYPEWYRLYFFVSRMNNPADGLRVSCPKLQDMRGRNVEYNVYVNNADSAMNGRRDHIKNLFDLINLCTKVANVAGCRQIVIEPE